VAPFPVSTSPRHATQIKPVATNPTTLLAQLPASAGLPLNAHRLPLLAVPLPLTSSSLRQPLKGQTLAFCDGGSPGRGVTGRRGSFDGSTEDRQPHGSDLAMLSLPLLGRLGVGSPVRNELRALRARMGGSPRSPRSPPSASTGPDEGSIPGEEPALLRPWPPRSLTPCA
jgi:hypothetical protein